MRRWAKFRIAMLHQGRRETPAAKRASEYAHFTMALSVKLSPRLSATLGPEIVAITCAGISCSASLANSACHDSSMTARGLT